MKTIQKLSFWQSFLLFFIPSLYFWGLTQYGISYATKQLMIHPALSWFIAGYLIFIPLFMTAIYLTKREQGTIKKQFLLERLRLHKLSIRDWLWALGGAIVILVLTGLILFSSKITASQFGWHQIQTTPQFMQFKPFQNYERFYLLIWLPMFLFNIIGEEILWRGYILPRQELTHGNKAWLINSILWTVFHICFGLDLVITLIPILFIIPYCVQKTKNTWTGIIIHSLLNGPMFVLISLGLLK